MLRKKLPAINGLVTFEAAARRLSFTEAADELSVTQAAVSRQIKRLEDKLGCQLFLRVRRHLELSVEGERLFQAATMGLGHIATVCDDIRRSTTLEQVTIAATHAFSSFWLMPRIRTFQHQNPDIKVHVVATDNAQELFASFKGKGLTSCNTSLYEHQHTY